MNLILVSRDDADQQSLMHYRTPGSVNGVRRYQDKFGRLTPEGRRHYGIGDGLDAVSGYNNFNPQMQRQSNGVNAVQKQTVGNTSQVNKQVTNNAPKMVSNTQQVKKQIANNSPQMRQQTGNIQQVKKQTSNNVPQMRQQTGNNAPQTQQPSVNNVPQTQQQSTNDATNRDGDFRERVRYYKQKMQGQSANNTPQEQGKETNPQDLPIGDPRRTTISPAPKAQQSVNNAPQMRRQSTNDSPMIRQQSNNNSSQMQSQNAQQGDQQVATNSSNAEQNNDAVDRPENVNDKGELTDSSGKSIGETTADGKYFGKGNIDLNSRPVVKNDDGSISTEQSLTIGVDDKTVLIPTVVNGQILDDEAAIDYYFETGEHLGEFDSGEEADAYAEALHNRQDWYYHQAQHSDKDDNYLMHYRTEGSKNGQRLYQNKDGSLTPEGYKHYSEMYGWGKFKKNRAEKKAEKAEKKAKKAEEEANNIKDTSNWFIKKSKSDNTEDAKKPKLLETIRKARGMTDEELNSAIDRLQREKRYAELVKEQNDREKGPLRTMVNKAFENAARDLATKSLNVAVDKIVNNLKDSGNSFKLSDYKDVDPYSLSSDKLKLVSEAFNNAANMARNRNVVNNGGFDPNQQNKQNNNQNNGQNNKPNNNQNTEQKTDQGDGNAVSKNQRKKMRSMANSGKSAAEIAKALGVSESTVQAYAGEQLKKNNEKETESSTSTIDRPETSSKGVTQAEINRKKMKQNLKVDAKNVKKANKVFDSFKKKAANESVDKDKEERIKRFTDWVNGSEWEKEKVRIREEQAQDIQRRKEENARKQARLFGYSW